MVGNVVDLGVKRQLYVRAGVGELWLVDPQAKTLTRVFSDDRDTLHRAADTVTSDLLPGFALPLADVFVV